MYLQSISHAVPPQSYTQAECWEILKKSPVLSALKPRSQALLEKVLRGDSGIVKRHLATEQVDELFALNAEALNQKFEREAPKLAENALDKALVKAGLQSSDLDALFICTCTGYLCPGLTSYVAERMGISDRAYLQDIVGLGCGAAIPTLRSAHGFLAANPNATVACIAVEICSAAFYLDDDPGVLISASLFGDAASASIWSNQNKGDLYRIGNFNTIHVPEKRELLRFTNCQGKLKNQLDRSVPEVAARAVMQLYSEANLQVPHQIAAHVGGRDVLDALESELDLPRLQPSWDALANYGNTSSPSVLIAAETIIESQPAVEKIGHSLKNEVCQEMKARTSVSASAKSLAYKTGVGTQADAPKAEKWDDTDLALKSAPEKIWLTSFGAGFAAHSCELTKSY